MSNLEAALIVAAVLVVGLPVTYAQIRRAQRHESERDRIIRASLLTPEAAREVDDLEIQYSLPAYDPAWNAGLERLWDAIRDEHTNHQGDQS